MYVYLCACVRERMLMNMIGDSDACVRGYTSAHENTIAHGGWKDAVRFAYGISNSGTTLTPRSAAYSIKLFTSS